jgi:hypothetical protein
MVPLLIGLAGPAYSQVNINSDQAAGFQAVSASMKSLKEQFLGRTAAILDNTVDPTLARLNTLYRQSEGKRGSSAVLAAASVLSGRSIEELNALYKQADGNRDSSAVLAAATAISTSPMPNDKAAALILFFHPSDS